MYWIYIIRHTKYNFLLMKIDNGIGMTFNKKRRGVREREDWIWFTDLVLGFGVWACVGSFGGEIWRRKIVEAVDACVQGEAI